MRYVESPKTLKQIHRQRRSRNHNRRASGLQPALDVVNSKQYVMVLGEPGCGKSTFLRALGLEALKGSEGNYRRQCFPLLVPLRHCQAPSLDLQAAICDPLQRCDFPELATIVTALLNQGRLLLLLDGLDEVPSANQDRIQQDIQTFVDRYPKNRFVISCRKVSGYTGLRRFTTTEVAPPRSKEVATLLRQQLPLFLSYGSDFIDHLKTLVVSLNLPWMRDNQHTPLFLMVLCWVYSYTQRIPSSPSAVYQEAVELLLENHRNHDVSLRTILKADLEKALLAEIAFQGLSTQMILYDRATLTHLIQEFLDETVDLDDPPTVQQLLDCFCYQGILVAQEGQTYAFVHRAVQEYLTAYYLAQYDSQIGFLIQDRITDLYWREVFLLLAGQVDCGDRLLLLMEEAAQQVIQSDRLRGLLRWADQSTTAVTSSLKPATRRVAALAVALDRALDLTRTLQLDAAIDYALHLNLDLAGLLEPRLAADLDRILMLDLDVEHPLALELDETLETVMEIKKLQVFADTKIALLVSRLKRLRPQIPTTKDSQAQKAFTQQVLQGWLGPLELELDWIRLTEAEAIELQRYLYINLLIEECRQVAVRVSRSVWQGIEARMLIV
ncbi:MAG: NACHT domain-containing protein [Prochlorothrix sp.]|nr:NACHT domain-containing protein [Prochlorothrix sp.]